MPAKSKRSKIIFTIIAILFIALLAWWLLKPKEELPSYITAQVERGDIENSVIATGLLEATKIVSVGAQASGQLKKMYVELGDEVKQGQLIAQINSVTQENEIQTAQASIKNQQAQLAVRQATLAQVQAEYNRQKNMYAQDATSKAELESALASYKTAQAEIVALNAQIEQSRLTLATAQEELGYTRIIAPMDGTVVAIVTEEGQTVNANQSAPTIVKLAKLDTMTVNAEISEADVMKVEKGQSVYFTTLGDSEKKYYATLRQIEPAPESISDDSSSSSSSSSSEAIYYNALFDVPNEDGKLRIDMTAQVSIIIDQAKNVLTIPSSAIETKSSGSKTSSSTNKQSASSQKDAGSNTGKDGKGSNRPTTLQLTAAEQALIDQGKATRAMVRVLQADGTAKPTPVLVGLNNRVTAQVLKGLKEGDEVVISDSADTSNDAAKRNNRGPMRM
ncbi:MacA family efflux pump subunit [Acinetobacter sp. A3.8]|uniref:MacA family efflux pump subunit n=1 Tax=Acinetobacter sedimenti TaxID=2919922 RepID=A0A9X1WUP0_9GAMM|nr:MacA family efflux pump subunit [Acinetobacter sedimenti]MCJ8145574.1 MacA family efflux pump subunit [Acinetobacter sedimenti]